MPMLAVNLSLQWRKLYPRGESMNRIFTTLAILLSLLSFFYATDNACANHDIRISWGAYLSTSKLTGLIPLATPQFDIGYRFFDNHVGIYLDTTRCQLLKQGL